MDERLNPVFWSLRIGLGLTAFLAGPDKFAVSLVTTGRCFDVAGWRSSAR